MRKAFMAATLALAMTLTAVSAFAATPAKQPRVSPATFVKTAEVSTALASEIFLAAPGSKPLPAEFYWGSCSWTCESCYSAWGCPKDEFGRFQSCLAECP